MKNNRLSAWEWVERILAAVVFTAAAAGIMIVFSPWGSKTVLLPVWDYVAKIAVSLLLLILALLARKRPRLERYWQIIFALFILTVVVTLQRIFGYYLIKFMGVTDVTPAGWALPKLNECFVAISVIVILTLLSGGSLGSIYLQKGRLKLGLLIGLGVFAVFALGGIPMASLFKAQDLSLARIVPWIPWLLIHVLANGAMEEMMFRGLFLRKIQPLFGKFISIFLLAFIFTGLHLWVTYTADQRIFIAVTFPLALILGWVMQKTDSAWGSILFHAGMDIPIMLGTFSLL
jgi:membrane protease YdiL (CAAX protease family)